MTKHFPRFSGGGVGPDPGPPKSTPATGQQRLWIADVEARLTPQQISDLRKSIGYVEPLTYSHASSYLSAMRCYLGERSRWNKKTGRRAAARVRIWEAMRKEAELRSAEATERRPEPVFVPELDDEVELDGAIVQVAALRDGKARLRGRGAPPGWINIERLKPV